MSRRAKHFLSRGATRIPCLLRALLSPRCIPNALLTTILTTGLGQTACFNGKIKSRGNLLLKVLNVRLFDRRTGTQAPNWVYSSQKERAYQGERALLQGLETFTVHSARRTIWLLFAHTDVCFSEERNATDSRDQNRTKTTLTRFQFPTVCPGGITFSATFSTNTPLAVEKKKKKKRTERKRTVSLNRP